MNTVRVVFIEFFLAEIVSNFFFFENEIVSNFIWFSLTYYRLNLIFSEVMEFSNSNDIRPNKYKNTKSCKYQSIRYNGSNILYIKSFTLWVFGFNVTKIKPLLREFEISLCVPRYSFVIFFSDSNVSCYWSKFCNQNLKYFWNDPSPKIFKIILNTHKIFQMIKIHQISKINKIHPTAPKYLQSD